MRLTELSGESVFSLSSFAGTFHEFTAKKKKEEQEEKRLQIKRTRDNFRLLLGVCSTIILVYAPSFGSVFAAECTFVNAETRLKDIKKEFGEDPRWKECDDADKEQLLEDRVSGESLSPCGH